MPPPSRMCENGGNRLFKLVELKPFYNVEKRWNNSVSLFKLGYFFVIVKRLGL